MDRIFISCHIFYRSGIHQIPCIIQNNCFCIRPIRYRFSNT
nr:MAG TPA: hypothetical protein [Caudoviricetes sp.]